MRKLILRNHQSPGDITVLTAVPRELHAAHPGQFEVDVRTSAPALWENNPRITPLSEKDRDAEVIDMHYPLIHQSNQKPFHFTHAFVQFLEKRLGITIPVTRFGGEIFLSEEERESPLPGYELPDPYWIIVAGGKEDFTAKWWNPASYQRVVDHYRGAINFVQCGEAGHWHLPLDGVVNLVGKTSLREFVRLMHHAAGVVCPVTLAMHLAAAVETRTGRPKSRPCIVVAGGREPTHWEAYPHHQYITTVGSLSCCAEGGCWRSRCQLIGDGDEKDRHNVCELPVQITPDLRIPRCMEMITPADVIRRIGYYLEGDVNPPSSPAITNGHTSHVEYAFGAPSQQTPPSPTADPSVQQPVTTTHRRAPIQPSTPLRANAPNRVSGIPARTSKIAKNPQTPNSMAISPTSLLAPSHRVLLEFRHGLAVAPS